MRYLATAVVTLAVLVPGLCSTARPYASPAAVEATWASEPDGVFLDDLARDTWAYLSSNWATDNHLPWSWRSASVSGGDYANPTEIGLYAVSWLGAYEMQRPWSPSWTEVDAEVTAVLNRLRAWQTGSQPYQPHGPNAYNNSMFYQWYWINWNPPVVGENADDHVVPSIDNAFLAASLITIREYGEAKGHQSLAQKADAILADMDFLIWYDPYTHRFSLGASENPQGGSVADYYSNENRIVNFVARALGQLSAGEFRSSLAALTQNSATYDGIAVEKVAWDGSFFTYAAPALFIRETSTTYSTHTIEPAMEAQIAYAQKQGYPAWGFSDCYDVGTGGYVQQGAPPAASPKPVETRPGLVTPHASALSLITFLKSQALTNLRVISDAFPTAYDSGYGFRDSVMVKPGEPDYGVPSARFSALGQEWLFLSVVNAETSFIWNYLYRDEGVRRAHSEMYDAVHWNDTNFKLIWERTDKPVQDLMTARSWMWGPNTVAGSPGTEPYAEAPGGNRTVQYFDKSRMEVNDPSGDRSSLWFVTNGLLVKEMVSGQVQMGNTAFTNKGSSEEAVAGDPAAVNVNAPTYATFKNIASLNNDHPSVPKTGSAVIEFIDRPGTISTVASPDSSVTYAFFESTLKHNIPNRLWDFMNQTGPVYWNGSMKTDTVIDWVFAMGLPITEPYWIRARVDGVEKDILVQLFERRALTYTPSNPAGFQVEMGNVGQHYYRWRYVAPP